MGVCFVIGKRNLNGKISLRLAIAARWHFTNAATSSHSLAAGARRVAGHWQSDGLRCDVDGGLRVGVCEMAAAYGIKAFFTRH